jgi:hypothetical protein
MVPAFVPLPEGLTRPCERPPFPDRTLVEDTWDLTAELYSAIDRCNGQIEEIRTAQPKTLK